MVEPAIFVVRVYFTPGLRDLTRTQPARFVFTALAFAPFVLSTTRELGSAVIRSDPLAPGVAVKGASVGGVSVGLWATIICAAEVAGVTAIVAPVTRLSERIAVIRM